MEVLRAEKVEKYYGNAFSLTKALDGLSLTVQKGDFVAIMGPSGSGKTTLLNCISSIDRVSSGHIYINGKDITSLRGRKLTMYRRNDLGFIFQEFHLLDTMTAFENIALALQIKHEKAVQIEQKIMTMANYLGIADCLQKYPYQLSGGQRQRVACARALVIEPQLVLADEPTGALDSKSARQLLATFASLHERLSSTILMVTHDAFTASYASRVVFIKDGRLFHEFYRGSDDRKQFFSKIIDVESLLGGDANDVI